MNVKNSQVIFVNPNNKLVCKKAFLTLSELYAIKERYRVYMFGYNFIIPEDYNKISYQEIKPEGFALETGISQTIMMYNNMLHLLDYRNSNIK